MSATVRDGYKRTSVGVIPKDWDVKSIGGDIDLLTGFPFPSSGYSKSGIRLLRGSNVKRGVTDWAEEITQYWPTTSGDFRRYELRVGDVVIAMDGSLVGRSSAKIAATDLPALLLQRVARLRSTRRLDVGYLNSFIGSDWFVKHTDAVKTVTAIPHISPADILSFTIPIPPTTAEQIVIAAALSDVDALLSKLDALIAKNRDLKQAAMQQLLTGRTRLPGFSGKWEIRPLASVVEDLEAGVSVNSVEEGQPLGSGELCILKTSAIFDGRFDPEECKLIDRRDIGRAKLSPRRDTIIISRMNTPNLVGEVGYVPTDFPTLCLPDRLWMTRFGASADLCPRWLAYLMSSNQVKGNIKGLATGTSGSMKNIGKSAFLGLSLAFPPGAEQTAIATILSDMDTEIAALEARRDKSRALKQGMMQELLTGRIRLL